MHRIFSLVIILVCLPTAALSNEKPEPIESLEELSWILGDWRYADPEKKGSVCWSRDLGGKAFVAEVLNGPDSETPTGMLSILMEKPGDGGIVAYTFDQQGGISVSDLLSDGKRVLWQGTKTFPDGTSGRGGMELDRASAAEYTARRYFLDGDTINYFGDESTMVRLATEPAAE